MKFSLSTLNALKNYVYALVDPRNNSIFYIGKANANNRAFDHLQASPTEGKKSKLITTIRQENMEPKIEILRYGLDYNSAAEVEVEAAIIDTIGLENLTNEIRGHGVKCGRNDWESIERSYGAKPIGIEEIPDKLILFFTNKTYSPTLDEQGLYDNTRQFWHQISPKNRKPNSDGRLPYSIGLSVADGVVIRAYSIVAWFEAGKTFSTRKPKNSSDRWEFVGELLKNHPLVGRRLEENGDEIKANQKGYRYIN